MIIADLHVHSRYSRATSPDMNPLGLARWARIKGIGMIGTGDFTHPLYFKEISGLLTPAGDGLFRVKADVDPIPNSTEPLFLIQGEISSIYKKNGRTRKVHSIVLMPGMAEAAEFNRRLAAIGNIHSDGRPILGLDARRLLEIALEVSDMAVVIPAHIWTPHFSLFGAASGFDSIEECYEDLSPHIYALETGLSADPIMCRRLSQLDRYTLVSNSDAHSPAKLGREANVLDIEPSYPNLVRALRTREGFKGTIEFFPEEGKYHHDGHRDCGVSVHPDETRRLNNKCPKCGKPLTIGVLHRVIELADRGTSTAPGDRGSSPPGQLPLGGYVEGGSPPLRDAPDTPFRSIVPLEEIISQVIGRGVNTKGVRERYHALVNAVGPEFHVLLDAPVSDIERASGEDIASAIDRMRRGMVRVTPGFDGEYGRVEV